MTFKWPSLPSPQAPAHEIADFAELVCWRDASASALDVTRTLGRIDENEFVEGVPEEDEIDEVIQESYAEIEFRQETCQDSYPFQLSRMGNTIQEYQKPDSHGNIIYKYLLLATRLDMNANRYFAGIDGTNLLEDLAAGAAREYFGDRAESVVFGTASSTSSFPQRVEDLCKRLGEGGGFRSDRTTRTRARDGKLDVVAWKHFSDGLPGKMIGFGQCKTGTHYRDELAQLQPQAFREEWLNSALIVDPIRMFFISEALPVSEEHRFSISIYAGLTFDRCRIIDFSGTVEPGLLARVKEWTSAAAAANDLPAHL